MKTIYLDYAAATPLRKEALEAMMPYLTEEYGNPSSLNNLGFQARDAVDLARNKISKVLNCKSSEIFFTSSGTESINLALKGTVKALKDKGNHIITLKTEHHAILHTCAYLEKHENCKVTYLDVNKDGTINLEDLKQAITKNTILITISYANNEIGTIHPIQEIANIAREHKVIFHSDACQVVPYLTLDTKELNIDLLTINSSKAYGPKGVGCLFKKTGTVLHPLIHGGGQENNLRSGTENVPGVVGFAIALELCQKEKEKESQRLTALRDATIHTILKEIPSTQLNGHKTKRLPNNINITFKGLDGEALLLTLNDDNIAASSGAACSSKSKDPSHVLQALTLSKEEAQASIRFTLGKETTQEQLDYLLNILPKNVEDLRSIDN